MIPQGPEARDSPGSGVSTACCVPPTGPTPCMLWSSGRTAQPAGARLPGAARSKCAQHPLALARATAFVRPCSRRDGSVHGPDLTGRWGALPTPSSRVWTRGSVRFSSRRGPRRPLPICHSLRQPPCALAPVLTPPPAGPRRFPRISLRAAPAPAGSPARPQDPRGLHSRLGVSRFVSPRGARPLHDLSLCWAPPPGPRPRHLGSVHRREEGVPGPLCCSCSQPRARAWLIGPCTPGGDTASGRHIS